MRCTLFGDSEEEKLDGEESVHSENRIETTATLDERLGEEESTAVADVHGAENNGNLREDESRVEGREVASFYFQREDRSNGGIDYVASEGPKTEEEVIAKSA